MAISRIGRALPNPDVELPPRPTAPPVVAPPRPSVPDPGESSFEDPRPSAPNPSVSGFDSPKNRPLELNPSEGRKKGTNDDSIGRRKGTNDDSIGRKPGTNDDSIGGAGAPEGETATTCRDLEAVGPAYTAAAADHDPVEELSPASQNLAQALAAKPAVSQAVDYALRSDTFASLPVDQREKFIEVMAKGDDVTVKLMAVTCEKAGDLFSERASDGSTTLDSLAKMADSPSAKQFLNHTLADVLKPDRIWQGDAPTCTVSTMQYELAKEKPAEYARLMTGLTTEGSVTLAGGGKMETQVSNAVLNSLLAKDKRSPTEAVFQSAAMEFANGADDYDIGARQSVHANADGTTKTYQGLYGEQIRNMVGELFGIDYTTTRIETDAEAAAALTTLNKSNVPNRPVLVDLVIDETHNHCVAFEGYSNGMVYFRDPQTGKKSSITEKEFIETAAAVHVAPMPKPKPRVRSPKMQQYEE